ncbi:type I-E CRISPR-associated protein Cse2/CasB [Atopobacter sp. AH10]|uniref:type I-E CRISPR-associated protein Cse2/CasB n=1 Tax=Atopobacter sp. AH10 TaxID=2315861 RepID=UPI000EF1A483|nr:type I-E CRISPR-associated protein Cse2/CasB [Atopobacter sp. AH10]RLK64293.1 type I-E CRISPR-associated protein Cse2/CasB [Atopobacter sp. AH10]
MEKKNNIYSVSSQIFYQLDGLLNQSSGKAYLAKLRQSIGKPLSQSVEIWPFIFDVLPEDALGISEKNTDYEEAVLTGLQMYALFQQGKADSVLDKNETGDKPRNFGAALSALRQTEDTSAADRRFNAMITSSTFDEFKYYVRQMIQLLKSKAKDRQIKINFPKLTADLYYFKKGYQEKVRLNWSKAYYRYRKMNEGAQQNEK